MSADNWAICPRCHHRALVEHEAKRQAALDSYGTVPLAEFEELRYHADVPFDDGAYHTFREDYEFSGAEEGVIYVRYKGRCTVCNLSLEIEQDHPFYIKGEEPAL